MLTMSGGVALPKSIQLQYPLQPPPSQCLCLCLLHPHVHYHQKQSHVWPEQPAGSQDILLIVSMAWNMSPSWNVVSAPLQSPFNQDVLYSTVPYEQPSSTAGKEDLEVWGTKFVGNSYPIDNNSVDMVITATFKIRAWPRSNVNGDGFLGLWTRRINRPGWAARFDTRKNRSLKVWGTKFIGNDPIDDDLILWI